MDSRVETDLTEIRTNWLVITKKFNFRHVKNRFVNVCIEAVVNELLEDCRDMFDVGIHVVREYENVVELDKNKYSGHISKNMIHPVLKSSRGAMWAKISTHHQIRCIVG